MAESGSPRPETWWHERDFGSGVSQCMDVREIFAQQTEYQRLQIFEHALLGRILALDGVLQTTQADEFFYHEMMAHVPILGRPGGTRSVLIIGGGDGGLLREVLLHPQVERVVMVEIDGAVIEASREYLGINGDYDDPRVELILRDAGEYVRSAAARERPFDVAIVDSTDPGGPSQVLFTDAFVADLAACLVPDGAMVRQVGLPFFQRDELPEAAAQARRAFERIEVYRAAVPTYSGGDMAFLVGLRGGGTLRVPQHEHSGRYYNPEIHSASFVLPTWWRELIAG
jgi:spermidine synthase